MIATADHPERALAAREASDLVQSILQMLEPELRESIVFRDLEDRDYREIAAAVGIPVGAICKVATEPRARRIRAARATCATIPRGGLIPLNYSGENPTMKIRSFLIAFVLLAGSCFAADVDGK